MIGKCPGFKRTWKSFDRSSSSFATYKIVFSCARSIWSRVPSARHVEKTIALRWMKEGSTCEDIKSPNKLNGQFTSQHVASTMTTNNRHESDQTHSSVTFCPFGEELHRGYMKEQRELCKGFMIADAKDKIGSEKRPHLLLPCKLNSVQKIL